MGVFATHTHTLALRLHPINQLDHLLQLRGAHQVWFASPHVALRTRRQRPQQAGEHRSAWRQDLRTHYLYHHYMTALQHRRLHGLRPPQWQTVSAAQTCPC